MRAPANPPLARRSGIVVTAIDDFQPLEFPWCSTPTQISPRGRLRGITLAGNLLVLGFMLGLGTWASLAPLESAAIASGVVESESSRKTIQHLEGGIVRKILVSDGDTVRSGQTLIALDDTRAGSEMQSLQGQLWDAAARAARLQAEQQRFERIAIPEALEQDSKQSGVAAAAVSAQEFIFQARLQVHESQLAVIRERRRQVEKEIEGLKAQENATGQRVDIVREELDMVATLVTKGLERRPRLLNLQRELADVEGRRGEIAAQISRAGQVISEQQATLFKLESERQNEIAQSLREAQSQIFQLRERLLAARDQLSRTEVKAPEDGVITDLRIHTAGGVIGAGAPLMDLVPRQDRLIVSARLRPEDIDVVHPGLSAEVHLVPYNQRRVPRLKGTVVHVSADRLLDKRTDQPYYATRIRIDDAQVAANDIQIVPGMPVQVFITTGRGTVALYALRPLLDSFRGAFRED
ncbi:HlyD family type I secretion periplasmic adaptor subunit [Bradyrhizobium sp. CCGB20]|uniref:HlyD family type I secretion periplasmic adaptor subunit n=1 Tax=Bradyrhizobium sp. CCGB20 TaxID=2949633 RepID=UPI0020B38075|nr:HlyD family type I secretion periplasmic adaptor subunit [Bradyrhizobium sp. CCGB20]MCP3397315.1 HlyD family type I secretion periplasmic adaptor subunit [Bradyrhizobium sp. CCGB20]